ncbi:MAG: lipopolysaccharide heptosyltransferase I [Gammaproteobacteria bacterium]
MKVLIVKMTSMGDIIHLFPALTDATIAIPNISFDWIIEDSFKELPRWHKAVDEVFPVALRRWRKAPLKTLKQGEIQSAFKPIRQKKYDLIIDAQGLVKSAIVAMFAKGPRAGLDRSSARERFAAAFYQKKCTVNFCQHAVVRMRELFSKLLSYQIPAGIDYGLRFEIKPKTEDYLLFFHGTTWPHKHWPENYWRELLEYAAETKYQIYLPWGNEVEKLRAEKLSQTLSHVKVLPKMGLTDLADKIVNAKAVVAVDTGLAHVSAALATPTISLYGPTDPKLTGAMGNNQVHLAADFSCAPCLSRRCNYNGSADVFPACFSSIKPKQVWMELQKLIA